MEGTTTAGDKIAGKLILSATSAAPHYAEAREAGSRNEALEELRVCCWIIAASRKTACGILKNPPTWKCGSPADAGLLLDSVD
jgi:hypothetical protein